MEPVSAPVGSNASSMVFVETRPLAGNACHPEPTVDRSIVGNAIELPAAPVTRSRYGALPKTLIAES